MPTYYYHVLSPVSALPSQVGVSMSVFSVMYDIGQLSYFFELVGVDNVISEIL